MMQNYKIKRTYLMKFDCNFESGDWMLRYYMPTYTCTTVFWVWAYKEKKFSPNDWVKISGDIISFNNSASNPHSQVYKLH